MQLCRVVARAAVAPPARVPVAAMSTTAKFWSKLSAAAENKAYPHVISSGQGACRLQLYSNASRSAATAVTPHPPTHDPLALTILGLARGCRPPGPFGTYPRHSHTCPASWQHDGRLARSCSLVLAPCAVAPPARCLADLTIGGKDYLNFCSSHYLGFAEEPRLKKAAKDAIDLYGLGTGYRTLAGTHALHIELEDKIAHFKGTEAAVTFSSAYAANASAVQTILGKEDIVVSDQLNHASIIDAVKVSGVQNKFAYKHSDMADLEAKLIAASELQKTPKSNGEHPLILIITDGVFSMDGDLARLPEIVDLAKKYDALTMVDDAHGEGVLGHGGPVQRPLALPPPGRLHTHTHQQQTYHTHIRIRCSNAHTVQHTDLVEEVAVQVVMAKKEAPR